MRPIIFVLGGPGAGKTTVCSRLTAFGNAHLHTGALLRRVRNAEVRRALAEGRLVRAEVVCKLLRREVFRQPYKTTCLLDGFPRDAASKDLWDEKGPSPWALVELVASEEVRTARCLARGDDPDTLKTRMRVYREQTEPIVREWTGGFIFTLMRVYAPDGGHRWVVDAEQPIDVVVKKVEDILLEVVHHSYDTPSDCYDSDF